MANKNDERKTAAQAAEEPKEELHEPVGAKGPRGAISSDESPSGIWTYIGPNIKGYIHTGKTFRGTRAQVLGQAERALEAEPRVQRLIVAGEKLAQARVTVRTPGNALYETFQAIYEDEKKKEAKSV